MNKARIFYFSIFFIFLQTCFFSRAMAQEEEPAQVDTADYERPMPPVLPLPEGQSVDELQIEEVDSVSQLDPGTSAFYSAVLPGLGQAYNDSHWKIPLIYIGGAFVAYSVNFNNRQYSTALRNLNLILFDPAVTTINDRDETHYDRATTFYRRNRDYSIIWGGILYALNIVDAYVDAHLQDFDINDDLAIRIKPSLFSTPGGQTGTGIALTLHFK